MASPRAECGLIGKLLVLFLVVAALVTLVAIDAGSIVLTRFRASEVARDASNAAARAFAHTGEERAAKLAALKTIAASEEPVRLQRIRISSAEVTVVLTAHPDTLLLGRIGALADLTNVTVTDSSAPSG